jgi:ferredoxin
VQAGATSLLVASTDGFVVGDLVTVTGGGNTETRILSGVGSLLLDSPLSFGYPASAIVYVEPPQDTEQEFEVVSFDVLAAVIIGICIVCCLTCVFSCRLLKHRRQQRREAEKHRLPLKREAETVAEATKVVYPEWWQQTPRRLSSPRPGSPRQCSLLLPASSGQVEAVQELIDRTWKDVTTRDRKFARPPKIKVVQVHHNHNAGLWEKYVLARERVRKRVKTEDKSCSHTLEVQKHDADSFQCLGVVDDSVNEFMLFHGAETSACVSICEEGFMVNLAGSSTGALYGKGIYFGENSSKSDEYAREAEHGVHSGLCAMLLCRVACGRMYYTDAVKPNKDDICAACARKDPDFHSVLGDRKKARGTYREFVLFDSGLAYPEYLVTYRREEADITM